MAKSTHVQTVTDLLQDQVVMELHAEMKYHSFAAWCKVNNFHGFANWLQKQSEEERSHADKIVEYLIELDIVPLYGTIQVDPPEFDDLSEIFQCVLDSEQRVTESIHSIYQAALEAADHSAAQFLLWFIEEQREEEEAAIEMLELVEAAEDDSFAALLEMDRRAGER